ncbi:hypothetical protein Tco_0991399 [Tanacetum coccineum]|uniref:Uncharacterized protein n=1 Tax=Tanacetum coccineum TaxID=301880 RepID=A0ABQ5EZE6_9ASTR
MSDSESGDSDVKDFKDLDMIFELARLEQQQEEEAEQYLRKPDFNDIQKLYTDTIIFMVFRECLKALIVCTGNGEIAQKAWQGKFGRADK